MQMNMVLGVGMSSIMFFGVGRGNRGGELWSWRSYDREKRMAEQSWAAGRIFGVAYRFGRPTERNV